MIVLPPLRGILKQGTGTYVPPEGWTMAAPYITGTTTSGELLTAHVSLQDPMPEQISWQWIEDGIDIPGSTQGVLLLTDLHIGHVYRVRATGQLNGVFDSAESPDTAIVRAAAPPAAAPVNTQLPIITGFAQVGQTLRGDDGQWTGWPVPTFTYHWEADGTPISGATTNEYLLTVAEVGTVITFVVTATNTEAAVPAESLPTTAVLANNAVGTPGLYVNVGGMETGHYWAGFMLTVRPALLVYLRSKGFLRIRLTLEASLIQPVPFGPLNSSLIGGANYLDKIKEVIDTCAGLGMQVLVDIHDFGARTIQVTSSTQVFNAVTSFSDWSVFQATLVNNGVEETATTGTHNMYTQFAVTAGDVLHRFKIAASDRPFLHLIARAATAGIHPAGDYDALFDLSAGTIVGQNAGSVGRATIAAVTGEAGVYEVTLRSTVSAAGNEQIIVEGGDAAADYATWISTKRSYVGVVGTQPLTVYRYDALLNTSTVKGVNYGTADLPYSASGDLAGKFAGWMMANCDMTGVHGYEVMNEPHTQTADGCFQLMQVTIDSLRAAGWQKWIIIGGIPWQNGPTFWTLNPNLWKLNDPMGMLEFHAHGYPDWDSSGGGGAPGDPYKHFGPEAWGVPRQEGPTGAVTDIYVLRDRFKNFIDGCDQHGLVAGMGETGNDNGGGDTSLDCFQFTKDYVIGRSCSWYLWAAGDNWPTGYGYYIGLKANGLQNEMMVIVDDHFGNPAPTDFCISGEPRIALGADRTSIDVEYNGRIATTERITFSDNGGGGTFVPPYIDLAVGRNAKASTEYFPNGERIVLITAASTHGWNETSGGFYFSSEQDTISDEDIDYSRAENVISLNRQLVATYLGPLYTAIRDDGTTMDVYPVGQAINLPNVGKEPDNDAVLAWGLVAPNTGARLQFAYDQAPGSNNATPTAAVSHSVKPRTAPVFAEYPILAKDKYGKLEAVHTTATKMRLQSRLNVTGHAMVAKWRLTSGSRFIAWEHTYTYTNIGAGITQTFTANSAGNGSNTTSNDRGTFPLGVRKNEEHVYAYRWKHALAASNQRIGGFKSWRDGNTVGVQNVQATRWNVDYGAHDACMGWFRSSGVGTFAGAWSEIVIFRDDVSGAPNLPVDSQLLAISDDLQSYYSCSAPAMAEPTYKFDFRTATYTKNGSPITLTSYLTGVSRDATGQDLSTGINVQAVGELLDLIKTKKFAYFVELAGTATTSGTGNSHDFLAATHSGGTYVMGRLNVVGRTVFTGITTGGGAATITGTMNFGYAIDQGQPLAVAFDGGTQPGTQPTTNPWPNAITAVQLLKSYANLGLKCRRILFWEVVDRNPAEVVRAFNKYGSSDRGTDLASGYFLGPNWGVWFSAPSHAYTDALDGYGADYYRSYGCTINRSTLRRTVLQSGVEVGWGRRELAPTTFVPRAGFVSNLRKWVDKCLDVGMDVILDWHGFGNVNKVQTEGTYYTDTMWLQDCVELVGLMPNSPHVWLELMNEPGGVYPTPGATVVVTPAQYADFQIAIIVAVRAAGFVGPIVVSPYGSNGDVSQIQPQGDELIRCIDADPLNNIVISGHDYFQTSGYDANPDVVDYGGGVASLMAATRWARRQRALGKNVRLLLGEGGIPFSASNNGDTQREGEERLWFTANNRDIWIAQTVFSGGGNNPAYAFDNFVQFYNQPVKGERLTLGLMSQYGAPSDLSEAPPVCNVLPSISGSSIQGQVLTVNVGDWDRATNPFTYDWWHANATTGAPIATTGVTTSTYAQDAPDVGFRLICYVTASNEFGESTVPSTPSAVTQTAAGLIAPSFASQPSISGTLTVGSTLTLSKGTIAGFPVPTTTQRWTRNGYPIEGATALTYVLTSADLGKAISGLVVATNVQGTATGTAPNRSIPDPSAATIRVTAGSEISVSDLAAETPNVYAICFAASKIGTGERQVMAMDYDTGDRIVMTLITDDGWATIAGKEVVTWKTHAALNFDTSGRCYRCSVDQLPSQTALSWVDPGSTTWSAYEAAPQLLTRVAMTIDTGIASPYKDRLYVGGRVGDTGGCTIMSRTPAGVWATTTITQTADFNAGKLHSLACGSNGTVYGLWASRPINVNKPDGSPNGQATQFHLIKSLNGGGVLNVTALYQPRSAVLTTAGNTLDDCQLVVNPASGTLHAVFRESGASGIVSMTYLTSDDEGASWTPNIVWQPPAVGLPSGWGLGGHCLSANAAGHLLLQYYAQSATVDGTAARYVIASKDDGTTWSDPVSINGSNWTLPVSTTQRELLGGDRHISDVRVDGGFVGIWTSHLTANNRYNARIRPLTVS